MKLLIKSGKGEKDAHLLTIKMAIAKCYNYNYNYYD